MKEYPLLDALYSRRSRRFGWGMEIPHGPLKYKSQLPPTSLDPFEKFQKEEMANIEQTLLDLSKEHMNAELIIWPESPLPYLNSSPEMKSLLTKLNNAPIIISGAWEYKNNELFNSLTILGTNQSYFKRHLVPFGEYVPFERLIRGLIDFFDLTVFR